MPMCLTDYEHCLRKLEQKPLQMEFWMQQDCVLLSTKFFSNFNSKDIFFADPFWTRARVPCMVILTVCAAVRVFARFTSCPTSAQRARNHDRQQQCVILLTFKTSKKVRNIRPNRTTQIGSFDFSSRCGDIDLRIMYFVGTTCPFRVTII